MADPAAGFRDGRDSLGRGLDAGSIAAVVAADPAVQRERGARGGCPTPSRGGTPRAAAGTADVMLIASADSRAACTAVNGLSGSDEPGPDDLSMVRGRCIALYGP
jgi:hypothetical protein